ncbi:MAG: multicopper oxidase domain-containing protein [Bacteroidetes bacterium]|nr:multicopper oxidase domain-containing protein [Bacteroidota bacterium]MBS1629077.1 multicopper oxidase domain-containing protein [Bacteroidota bacterium]
MPSPSQNVPTLKSSRFRYHKPLQAHPRKYSIPLFLPLLILGLSSCQNASIPSTKPNANMVLGGPPAVVSPASDKDTSIRGPLAYAPNVPPLDPSDTVLVKFDVTHRIVQLRNGMPFSAWLFGNALPGPVLHLKVGQTVKFMMTNRSDDSMTMQAGMHPMPHSIDFHAAMVNPADKWRSINPGETISMSWTANYPGVFMYHCGTPMVLLHMISGMFGMVIVDPADGFPGKVDQELALIQNEFYLSEKPVDGHYTADTVLAMKKQPSLVAFNGKPNQYFLHPIHVKAGKRIRMYLLNVGPNNASSFHIIGTIFDKVWIEGNPKNQLLGMDVVSLPPATSAIVEFTLPEKGRYTFLDHSFADAEMGASGELIAD